MVFINGISYYLPENKLSNDDLNELFPDWSVNKIAAKTGIQERRIAGEGEFVSTMAVKAAKNLFLEYNISPGEVEFIILCTQSPDYVLPTTACLVQEELGIPTTSGALDINLGCSGYIYGLSAAKGLLLSEDVNNVLFITSETYSKYLGEHDKSVRTIFGDGASATFISKTPGGLQIGKTSFGTDGKGALNLMVKAGGSRFPLLAPASASDLKPADSYLFMNGAEIFSFTLKIVPPIISSVLEKNQLNIDDIDLFVFHQANKYMLEHLRLKMSIPEDKFFIYIENCGNTVSSTIPIAIKEAMIQEKIKPGMKVLLAGFGVGYSWGATIVQF